MKTAKVFVPKKKLHKRLTIIFIKIQKDDNVKSAVIPFGNTET